ncbi:YGGT family protein [gamma proteobacterium HTCC5015]|nr:YGGT family protein [gamma proteobacterium HTCC5015]
MGEALFFIVDTVFLLAATLFLLRLLAQSSGADFRNPISQGLVQITDPVLKPLRKVLPRLGRYDSAAALIVVLLMIGKVLTFAAMRGVPIDGASTAILTGYFLADLIINTYIFAILISVVMSWVAPNPYHPAQQFVHAITQPLLKPLRRLIPPIGGSIDIVPMIVLILLYALKIALRQTLLGA